MPTTDRQLTQRNGSLADLVTLLRDQHAAKVDVVIPAAGIRSSGGRWQIDGTGAAVLGPDGVTTSPGSFVPTGTCDAGMADKLGIPVAYVRRLRDEHLGLYDANINGWLDHDPGRRLLIRTLHAEDGDGIARRCCRSGTGSWTTSTSCWPSWTGSAAPARMSRCAGAI